MTEHEEAILLKEYLDVLQNQGKITLYAHVPNETFTRSWRQKQKNTAEGVKSGVPDYIIVTPKKVLFLELKKKKDSYPTPNQRYWLSELDNKETITGWAKGFDAAVEFITKNL